MILRPLRVLAVSVSLGACLAAPAPAQAHAILIGGTPAINAVLPPGPISIRLRFNSRIDQSRSRLALTDGPTSRTLKLTQDGPEDELDTDATLPPGTYALRWQVLAVDGHITRGAIPFTVETK